MFRYWCQSLSQSSTVIPVCRRGDAAALRCGRRGRQRAPARVPVAAAALRVATGAHCRRRAGVTQPPRSRGSAGPHRPRGPLRAARGQAPQEAAPVRAAAMTPRAPSGPVVARRSRVPPPLASSVRAPGPLQATSPNFSSIHRIWYKLTRRPRDVYTRKTKNTKNIHRSISALR